MVEINSERYKFLRVVELSRELVHAVKHKIAKDANLLIFEDV